MARKTVLRKRKTAISSVRTNKVDEKFSKFNSDQLINYLVKLKRLILSCILYDLNIFKDCMSIVTDSYR